MFSKKLLLSVLLVLPITSCGGLNPHSPGQVAAASGVGGAALGAGTGALIGSVISSGDVAMSTIAGTAIGLPLGAGLGYVYTKHENQKELDALDAQIQGNKQKILKTDEYHRELRRENTEESFVIEPDEDTHEELYLGPTLGNPYR